MKSILLLSLSLIVISCKNTPGTSVNSNPAPVTISDVADKLIAWSIAQPSPFVISYVDTNKNFPFSCDFVTNIKTGTFPGQNKIYDHLFYIPANEEMPVHHFSETEIIQFYNTIDIRMGEKEMSQLLSKYNLWLRMMNYRAITAKIDSQLLSWAQAQTPDKFIYTDPYIFVSEDSNTGGYSPAMIDVKTMQNLEYFTRKLSGSDLIDISNAINNNLTPSELKNILRPIIEIKIHDTTFAPA